MTQPRVVADDTTVEDLLLGTIDLIRDAGGWVAPGVTIVAHDGHCRIEFEGNSGPLLHIPSSAWVRVDRFTWSGIDDNLTIVDIPDDVGEHELPMAYLQAALHNSCRKLSWMRATHPSLIADLPHDITDAVRALIPSFRMRPEDPVDLLFANRCFRIPRSPGAPAERMLIPLVDLVNHHTSGATGSWDGEVFTIDAAQPFGTTECALDYGLDRDALEMAVVYGFADESARMAHSAPVAVDVRDVGPVRVSSSPRRADGTLADITVVRSDGVTTVSRVTFGANQEQTVDALVQETGWSRPHARGALEAIADVNVKVLDALSKACHAHDSSPAATILAEAAAIQRRKIEMSVPE